MLWQPVKGKAENGKEEVEEGEFDKILNYPFNIFIAIIVQGFDIRSWRMDH